MPKNTIVCRCEDITLEEIREWLQMGYTNIEEIKRLTRAGMGPCQGRTCRTHILRELSRVSEMSPAELTIPTFRPPVKPVSLKTLAGDGND
ncbi:MAG: (2Fe-2S)-binding protein [Clostridiales bacterium]|jgi:bacterioferritin-associated ferredoxin|nr:(2Fe-2S)-binding protein [Clostridiales bacterium]